MQPQDKEDSEGEEEESKEVRITTNILSPQDDPAANMTIDTRDEESKIAAANNDIEERKDDEIDEILEESKSYTKAISDRLKQGSNLSRLQAEPSHFHLAALAQERQRNPLKKITDTVPAEGEESK